MKIIMKRSFLVSRTAALVFIAGLAVSMANCGADVNDDLEPSDDSGSAREIVIKAEDKTIKKSSPSSLQSLTIMPTTLTESDVSNYVITLTKGSEIIVFGDEEGEDTTKLTTEGVKIPLSYGSWAIIIDAYRMADGTEYRAATGDEILNVTPGGANSVDITLGPIEEAGWGIFSWDIVLPSDVNAEITFAGETLSSDTGVMEKESGQSYDLNITFTNDIGQTIGIYETVQIYPGLITAANYNFNTGKSSSTTDDGSFDNSFPAAIIIAGNLSITKTSQPADDPVSYRVQAYSDAGCGTAIDGLYFDIPATGAANADIPWSFNMPVAAYRGTIYLRAVVIPEPVYYEYISHPVVTVPVDADGTFDISVSININNIAEATIGGGLQ